MLTVGQALSYFPYQGNDETRVIAHKQPANSQLKKLENVPLINNDRTAIVRASYNADSL